MGYMGYSWRIRDEKDKEQERKNELSVSACVLCSKHPPSAPREVPLYTLYSVHPVLCTFYTLRTLYILYTMYSIHSVHPVHPWTQAKRARVYVCASVGAKKKKRCV